jgi:diadenosine tetraphosphatase ApaH/serine/threonine PP2A family protein phosphatase
VERAVITDIHANLPALEAALEAIEWTEVDAVYCGGDPVGYGPHPNEVCALIEERGSVGKPKDGDPRTAFAVLRLDRGRVVADVERVEYNAEAVARQLAPAGLPGEYAEKLVLAA